MIRVGFRMKPSEDAFESWFGLDGVHGFHHGFIMYIIMYYEIIHIHCRRAFSCLDNCDRFPQRMVFIIVVVVDIVVNASLLSRLVLDLGDVFGPFLFFPEFRPELRSKLTSFDLPKCYEFQKTLVRVFHRCFHDLRRGGMWSSSSLNSVIWADCSRLDSSNAPVSAIE